MHLELLWTLKAPKKGEMWHIKLCHLMLLASSLELFAAEAAYGCFTILLPSTSFLWAHGAEKHGNSKLKHHQASITIRPINFKLRIQLPCGGRQSFIDLFYDGRGASWIFKVTQVKKVMGLFQTWSFQIFSPELLHLSTSNLVCDRCVMILLGPSWISKSLRSKGHQVFLGIFT